MTNFVETLKDKNRYEDLFATPQKKVSISSGGLSFTAALTLIFIVLKLVGVISWSWIWVLSPLWIPITIVLAFVLLILLVSLVALVTGKIKSSRY